MASSQKENKLGFYFPELKMFYYVPNEEIYQKILDFQTNNGNQQLNQAPGNATKKEDLDRLYHELMEKDIE